MAHLSRMFAHLLEGMMQAACVLLLAMVLMIGADVALRNIGLDGVAWSNEVCEYILYLITLLSAPWLLRRGQHIRVDILLRAVPPRMGWLLEWAGDLAGLLCSLYFVWYGTRVATASWLAGSISIKTLVIPEWWLLAPMPLAFMLVAIEFVFRMHRLARAERTPRGDAVSVA